MKSRMIIQNALFPCLSPQNLFLWGFSRGLAWCSLPSTLPSFLAALPVWPRAQGLSWAHSTQQTGFTSEPLLSNACCVNQPFPSTSQPAVPSETSLFPLCSPRVVSPPPGHTLEPACSRANHLPICATRFARSLCSCFFFMGSPWPLPRSTPIASQCRWSNNRGLSASFTGVSPARLYEYLLDEWSWKLGMYQHHYLSLKDGDPEAPTHEWAQAYKADNGRLKAPPEPAQDSTSCVVTSRNDVKR